MRKVNAMLCEAALVTAAGLLFALVANALSPRGLRLNRNYFPGGEASAPRATGTNALGRLNTSATNPLQAALQRLEQRGLQPISNNQVVALFRDLRYEQGLVVFIDARDDAHYQAGHIPGAWQLDHYRAETYLPALLPVCLNAQQVVVYCSGGTCEDSEFAAIMLRDAVVPRSNLFVYAGGITEWATNGLPVETGMRRSGQFIKPAR